MFSARLHPHYQGMIAMLIANAIWGAAPAIFKLTLTNISPFTLAFLRFFLASLLIFPFAATKLIVKKKDWTPLFLMTFCGITVNITCFFFGLTLAPSINAAIIATSAPLFLFLVSYVYFHETLKPTIVTGTLIGMLGIFLVLSQQVGDANSPNPIMGNILFILATIGAVGYVLAGKILIKTYAAETLTFWSFFLSSITFLPFFIYETHAFHTLSHLNMTGIYGLLYGVTLSSAAAYLIYAWGLQKVQTQEVGVFASIDPIIAVVISYVFLGEHIQWSQIVGTLLVCIGIIIAEVHLPYPLSYLSKHTRKKLSLSLSPIDTPHTHGIDEQTSV